LKYAVLLLHGDPMVASHNGFPLSMPKVLLHRLLQQTALMFLKYG
jgi:hypothetical protein